MCAFKFIKLSSEIHSPWSITDPQISIEWDPVIYSRRIVLSVHCTSALHFTCCITSHRSCTVGHEWISGYDLRIRSRRSIFIEYHSLGRQVNLYIRISDIICFPDQTFMGINRFSDLGFSVFYQFCKFFQLRFLIDLPAIIPSADSNLTTIICIKCSLCSNRIIFSRQFTDICFYLFFVKCIKTVFICCEPVFDHISVYCLCAVVKIIGYHYIRKFVYQVTILRQSFITLINFRFFVASICFQINRCSTCDKSIYNILTCFFWFQCSSLLLRNNYKLIVFLFYMSIRRLCHILLLHTFQFGNGSLCLLLIIFNGGGHFIIPVLIKSKKPCKTILIPDQFTNTSI